MGLETDVPPSPIHDDAMKRGGSGSGGGGGCPVKHGRTDGNVMGVIPVQQSQCPVKHTTNTSTSSGGWLDWLQQGRSIRRDDETKPTTTTTVNSLEEAAKHSQTPMADQRIPLSTHRVVSSILKGDSEQQKPHHQPDNNRTDRWVYPSEQQFYNAMRRKGWEGVDESTIPFVVRIHNEVNERGWREVCRWERELHDNSSPKLVKFMGRPNDISPKAFLFCKLLPLYKDPFDRHDWYVQSSQHPNDPPRRYVIDFYNGNHTPTTNNNNNNNNNPQQPSMYIDVRPAIDTPEALWDRIRMTARETFPGIFLALSSISNNSSTSNNDSHPPSNPTTTTTSKTQPSK